MASLILFSFFSVFQIFAVLSGDNTGGEGGQGAKNSHQFFSLVFFLFQKAAVLSSDATNRRKGGQRPEYCGVSLLRRYERLGGGGFLHLLRVLRPRGPVDTKVILLATSPGYNVNIYTYIIYIYIYITCIN